MQLLQKIVSFLFPTECIGCNMLGENLCIECVSEMKINKERLEKDVYAIFQYKDSLIKKAIWKLKYSKSKNVLENTYEVLADELGSILEDEILFGGHKNCLIVPVPLHSKKIKKRGYNQSEIIAKGIFKNLPNMSEFSKNLVIKIRNTKSQSKTENKSERQHNIRNSFLVADPKKVYGRLVVVIDDVVTTGATINEMHRILKECGAKKVISFCVAH